MRFVMRRSLTKLSLVDAATYDQFARYPVDQDLMVEIKQARNPKFHRLAFALFQTIADSTGSFSTLEALKTWMKIKLAYADPIIGDDGKTYWALRSLSYASMDEATFRAFFEAAVDLAVKTWGFERPALLAEIEERTGLRWTEAA